MARRMFSPKIISSARFLKMPIDSQLLYFHLGMHADDDGIVEAYSIIKLVGSNEDNLRVLSSKGLVKVLNDDLVTFITDWHEHNKIRADRKINSIYQPLLLQILPEVDLTQPKPRADTGKIAGQQMDVQRTTNGRHRLGKDRLGKDSKKSEVASDDTPSLKQKRWQEKDMEMVDLLIRLIEKNTPDWKMKGSKESWAEHIEKLHRIDGRSYEQIEYMIKWVQADTFWQQNILSTAKLRDKFSDLIPKLKASVQKSAKDENSKSKPKML